MSSPIVFQHLFKSLFAQVVVTHIFTFNLPMMSFSTLSGTVISELFFLSFSCSCSNLFLALRISARRDSVSLREAWENQQNHSGEMCCMCWILFLTFFRGARRNLVVVLHCLISLFEFLVVLSCLCY